MPQSIFEQTGKLAFLATAAALVVWSFYVPRSLKAHIKLKGSGNDHGGSKNNDSEGGNYAGDRVKVFFIVCCYVCAY